MHDLKQICPGCDAENREIGKAWARGEGCPYCGEPDPFIAWNAALAGFVEARLDEDERIATAALGEIKQYWTIETAPRLPSKHVNGRPSIETGGMGWETGTGDGIWSCDDPDDDCWRFRSEDLADAEHITRFDPKRVLADVKAKRAILAALQAFDRPEHLDPAHQVLAALAGVWRDHTDHPGDWYDDEDT